MRRLLLSIIAVTLTATAGSVFANTGDDWTPVQLSFMPGAKNWPSKNNVNGVKIGLPIGSMDGGLNQKVNGVELGFVSMSQNVGGVQLSLMNIDTKNCAGLQMSGASVATEFKGAQISGYNELNRGGGAQVGLVNVGAANKGFATGVVNYHERNSSGVQLGAINSTQNYSGIQIGAFNFNDDEAVPETGRQKSSVIQFGAINYMENGFLPVFILFNFSV
jgi:hypothetical protein